MSSPFRETLWHLSRRYQDLCINFRAHISSHAAKTPSIQVESNMHILSARTLDPLMLSLADNTMRRSLDCSDHEPIILSKREKLLKIKWAKFPRAFWNSEISLKRANLLFQWSATGRLFIWLINTYGEAKLVKIMNRGLNQEDNQPQIFDAFQIICCECVDVTLDQWGTRGEERLLWFGTRNIALHNVGILRSPVFAEYIDWIWSENENLCKLTTQQVLEQDLTFADSYV